MIQAEDQHQRAIGHMVHASIERCTSSPLDACIPLDSCNPLDSCVSLDACIDTHSRLKKGDLKRLFSNPGVIEAVAPDLGIPERAVPKSADDLGVGFCCVLPGHEEKNASAKLYPNDEEVFAYVCFHVRDEYMVRTYPKCISRSGPRRPISCAALRGVYGALRLLAEAGVREPVHVDLPDLPPAASEALRKVYNGIRLLIGIRWRDEPGTPVPFSWRFGAAWCGVAESTVGRAIKELLSLGVLRIVRHHRGAFGKRMALFMPGPGPHQPILPGIITRLSRRTFAVHAHGDP